MATTVPRARGTHRGITPGSRLAGRSGSRGSGSRRGGTRRRTAHRAAPASQPPGRHGGLPRLLRLATRLLTVLGAIAALALALTLTVLPLAVHGTVLTVLTGSMRPTIAPGAVVVDRPVNPEQIRTGDIITFHSGKLPNGSEQLVTHRIVEIHSSLAGLSFTTKGDANKVEDPGQRTAADVRGKVWFHLPQIGLWRQRLLSGAGGLVIGGLALGVWGGQTLLWALRPEDGPGEAAHGAVAWEPVK